MEKSWENFWTTGKVEDYLNYCNKASNTTESYSTESKENMSAGRGMENGNSTVKTELLRNGYDSDAWQSSFR